MRQLASCLKADEKFALACVLLHERTRFAIINSVATESEGTEPLDFIGRTQEVARLSRELTASGQHTVLLYGRRRVGKSELIKHCLASLPDTCIYYECKQTSEADNTASLGLLVAESLGLPPLAFSGMQDVLKFLFERAERERVVLVLDEYPYLREALHGLDSILQSLLDAHRHSSEMHLVLCGSYVGVMSSLLEGASPLYGRIDLALRIAPMDYFDSSLFYPDFSPADKVRLYATFGGIPYYNQLIDSKMSVRDNLMSLVVTPGARLENEIPFYLSGEISKMRNANEAFGALSRGFSRYSDILSQSHVSSGPTLVDVLDKLASMELVEKTAPINDVSNKRKATWRICDGLARFYYRYLFRHASQRMVMNPATFWERFIADDFERSFVPAVFEDVCRQYLIRKNRAGLIDESFDEIGRYWYDNPQAKTNGEFDIVTRGPSGYAFYEAKFKSLPVTKQMVEKEIEQVQHTGLQCFKYGFFSRSGFSGVGTHDDIECIVIEDLFESM